MSTPWTFAKDQPDSLTWLELHFHEPAPLERICRFTEHLAASGNLGTIAFEVRASKDKIRWLIGAPRTKIDHIRPLLGDLPVRITAVQPRRTAVTATKHLRISGRPLSPDPHRAEEVTRQIYSLASTLADDEQIVLQLLVGRRLLPPVDTRTDELAHWLGQLAGLLGTPPTHIYKEKVTKHGDLHGARAHLRVAVISPSGKPRHLQLLGALLGTFRILEAADCRISYRRSRTRHLDHVQLPWRWTLKLRSLDIAGLLAWPTGEPPLPLLDGLHPKQLAPPKGMAVSQRAMGVSVAPGTNTPASLSWQDALYHTHLLGPTGSGKSTTLLNLIDADIRQGLGTLVIDPKGDLVTDVLARIPEDRIDDVVVIDPTSSHPIGFNPLACHPDQAHVAADSLLSTFEALFKDNWGIRTADILSASLLTLARHPKANLLWLSPLLTDPAFRKKVLKTAPKDPLGTDVFWQRYDALKPERQATEIAPVLNKLRQIILRPGLRAVLGQTTPAFDFDELLSGNKIVLLSLNKGRIGSEAGRLLGSLVISHLWTKILARQALPARQRKIRTVYIDEVHDFLAGIPGDLADALAQARSLGVAFTLANQYREQLTPEMRSAIDANTRSKVCFGLNATDANAVAKGISNLDSLDFQLLPKYHAYVNLMNRSQPTDWFLATMSPPPAEVSDGSDVYQRSQLRYGIPLAETEAALLELITPVPDLDKTATLFGRKPSDSTTETHPDPAAEAPSPPPKQSRTKGENTKPTVGRQKRNHSKSTDQEPESSDE